jgi:hypothetical protein
MPEILLIVPDFIPEHHEEGLKLVPNQLVGMRSVQDGLVPDVGHGVFSGLALEPLYRQYFPFAHTRRDCSSIQTQPIIVSFFLIRTKYSLERLKQSGLDSGYSNARISGL